MREKKSTLAVRYIILGLIACMYVVPVALMLLGSLKTNTEVLSFDLSLPAIPQWQNYLYVLDEGDILSGYKNSIIITFFTTIISIVLGAFTGIVISRRNEKLTKMLYYYFIFGLTITLQTASMFYWLRTINLYGTYTAIILIEVAMRTPFTVMTFSSFVKGVPRDIDEAAIVDGCGPIRLVFGVLVPIMKPIMITNLILTAISAWNNFMVPLFYLTKSSMWPVTLSVYKFYGMYSLDWHYVFACLTLTAAPMIILFLCLQKYIVGGMTAGSVKG